MKETSILKARIIYGLTLFFGYILFIIPNIVFGVFRNLGGYEGINLLLIGVFQLICILLLLRFSLNKLGKNFSFIGFSFENAGRDASLGLLVGLAWLGIQYFLIPATGGAARGDVSQMLQMMGNGTPLELLCYIGLGVIGGGFAEEFFNRGFTINVLKNTFKNKQVGTWIAVSFSILLFCLGHIPTTALDWMDILVPTLLYTALFLYTKRLTAGIIAHSIYNATAIIMVHWMYFPN